MKISGTSSAQAEPDVRALLGGELAQLPGVDRAHAGAARERGRRDAADAAPDRRAGLGRRRRAGLGGRGCGPGLGVGAHVGSPSVMRKNSSSSVAVRGTSARRPMPAWASSSVSAATARSSPASDKPARGGRDVVDPVRPARDRRGGAVVGRAQVVAAGGAGDQLVQRALVDHAPAGDDRDAVAEVLDLVHQVRGQQHGQPVLGQPVHERAHVAHARGVEPGRRLVEQQQPRIAQQRPGDAEALLHAVRVAADLVVTSRVQVDGVQRVVDPLGRVAAVQRRHQFEVLAAGQVRIEARRLDEAGDAVQGARPLQRGGRARTASRCPRPAGSARAASAARSSCRRRWVRGIRRRRPRGPSGRRGRRR